MVTGVLFDPLVALRMAPLVSTTCSLLFARDQHFFLSLFNRGDLRQRSKPMLSRYFDTFFRSGLPSVFLFLGTTAATAIGNLFMERETLQQRGSFWFYVAGAVLASAHLLYVPLIGPSCFTLMDEKAKRDPNDTLDEWIWYNKMRSFTTDLGAWVAVFIAVNRSLQA